MQKFLVTGAMILALTAPAFAADNMSGPAQPAAGGMAASSDGMAHSDGMAMGKKKPMKKSGMKHDAMKHDAMKGDSMSGPAQTGGGMSGGMAAPATKP